MKSLPSDYAPDSHLSHCKWHIGAMRRRHPGRGHTSSTTAAILRDAKSRTKPKNRRKSYEEAKEVRVLKSGCDFGAEDGEYVEISPMYQ